MFGLIKWVFFLSLVGFSFFSFYTYDSLGQKEQTELKQSLKDGLDTGNLAPFFEKVKSAIDRSFAGAKDSAKKGAKRKARGILKDILEDNADEL